MKFVLELSWLWKSIAIIILVIAFCEICALLICKLIKRKFSKNSNYYCCRCHCRNRFGNCFAFTNAEFVKFKFIVYIKAVSLQLRDSFSFIHLIKVIMFCFIHP